MADARSGMNMGGGASRKIKLVTDLTEEYRKLNAVLEKTEKLSKSIADNLSKGKASANVGAPATAAPMTGAASGATSLGFINQGDPSNLGFVDQPSSGMSFATFAKKTAATVGAVAATTVAAMATAIDPAQFVENQMMRTRFGFYGGAMGPGQAQGMGSAAFRGMMRAGTGTDPLDAARAAMAGAQNGLMPGLANYASIGQSAATLSNLVPGAGLEGGMQATARLNQAQNVNRLRMIGVNVRDANTGLMRSFDEIASDLWNTINRQKTGSSPITAQDIALSLQPGNALDMMLDQYFGNDPVLRQGVVTALIQKAGGKGLSKQELIASGALPEVAESMGQRAAAEYGALDAYTGYGTQGIIDSNKILIDVANQFEKSVDVFGPAVQVFAGAANLLGGANGAIGQFIGGLSGILGPMLGSAAGNVLTKGGNAATKAGVLGAGAASPNKFLSGAAKFAGKALPVVGTALSAWSGWEAGAEEFNWGEFLTTTAIGTGTGALFGGLPGAGIGALVSGGGYLLGYGARQLFGQGGEDGGSSYPLSGSPGITSPFNEARGEYIDGMKNPTPGKRHGGVDFGVPTGSIVYAAKSGRVSAISENPSGYGKYVKLMHADGHESIYAHLSKNDMFSVGAQVSAGSVIGLSGNTGNSTGPHLHFEVKNGATGKSINPLDWLGGKYTSPSGTEDISAGSAMQTTTSLFGATTTADIFPQAAGNVSLFGADAGSGGGVGGDSSGGISYGGVTVHINVPKGAAINETVLAHEVKRILEDQKVIEMAVSR